MDITRINATLTSAIGALQTEELAMLWEFTVPTPQEMHRKHGMRLPTGMLAAPQKKKPRRKKTSPEPFREVSQSEAQAGAAKTQPALQRVFDKLKPKQIIWVSFRSPSMGGPKGFAPVRIGRRTYSKKYKTKSITLLGLNQKKPLSAGWQTKLYKRDNGDVSLAQGDLATMGLQIYIPPRVDFMAPADPAQSALAAGTHKRGWKKVRVDDGSEYVKGPWLVARFEMGRDARWGIYKNHKRLRKYAFSNPDEAMAYAGALDG